MTESVLKAIICGYERGGTTLIRNILGRHPNLDSGFEGGFLLAESPRDFLSPRFSEYNGSLVRNGWGITEDELRNYICQADTWNQLYLRLREKSRKVPNKSTLLFDKSPKYMERLHGVLLRMWQAPAIVIVRDPRAVIWSWIKRLENPDPTKVGDGTLKKMCRRYVQYAKGYHEAKKNHPRRILLVKYEQLCAEPAAQVTRIFTFLDLSCNREYLDLQPSYGVRGTSISNQYALEFRRHLPSQLSERILEFTQEAGW